MLLLPLRDSVLSLNLKSLSALLDQCGKGVLLRCMRPDHKKVLQFPPGSLGTIIFITQCLGCDETQETLQRDPHGEEQRPPQPTTQLSSQPHGSSSEIARSAWLSHLELCQLTPGGAQKS